MRTENNFWHKCLKPNCHSTFAATQLLDRHMRIHNNDLDSCQFCPYRYVEIKHYNDHLNRHFRIKAYRCDHCGLNFFSRRAMVEHASSHEGIKFYCLICKTYESTKKAAINASEVPSFRSVGNEYQLGFCQAVRKIEVELSIRHYA